MESTQLILTLSLCAALLITPSYSLTCTSQKFTSEKNFTDCIDLPSLGAYLHYTYNSSNSSLTIAYVAAPPKPEGWVAWAINPKSTGMVGSQALLAYKSKMDSIEVKTYDIKAYGPVKESKLSFDVWDLSGESNGDNLVIFASVKVPEKAEEVNQVWQVGPAVTDGNPGSHEMNEANLKSKGVLKLVGGGGESSLPPAGSASGTAAAPTGSNSAATSAVGKLSMASCLGVIVLICSFIGF